MLVASLVVIAVGGVLVDMALTRWAIKRFGESAESNPVVLYLHRKFGDIGLALPPTIAFLFALGLLWLLGTSALTTFALVMWAPVLWNLIMLGDYLLRRRR
jgi:hypothetical protein